MSLVADLALVLGVVITMVCVLLLAGAAMEAAYKWVYEHRGEPAAKRAVFGVGLAFGIALILAGMALSTRYGGTFRGIE